MSFPSAPLKQSADMHPIRAVSGSRAVFFTAIGLLYATAIVLATLTLNPYFSQTWDVSTFVHVAQRFLDGGNPFDLYAQSRAAQTWPYAYPPLHAFVTAIALFIGNTLRILPEYVWARVPVILADIGIAISLYAIISRKSNDESLARAAALLWLFNPVTFYDTAVQGHFESEWLLFVLFAYAWFEDSRNIVLPTIALAVAVLFKQVAILFAIPMWMAMLKAEGGRMRDEEKTILFHPSSFILHPLVRIIASLFLFAFVVAAVSLPFLLYSNDFLYMNLTYVENVPVQTQSWIVGLLGLTRAAPDAMTSDFFLLRYQSVVTMLAAAAISFFAARRGWSLYLAATLIAIAFFLTSKKVMGYYYVMLFPFLLVEVLPRRRFGLALIVVMAITWIALSPYYAAWTNHDHWWIYAVLGTLNSVFFAWLFARLALAQEEQIGTRIDADNRGEKDLSAPIRVDTCTARERRCPRPVLSVSLSLFAGAVFASLLQPFASGNDSPIRAPVVAAGMEWNALGVFGALVALIVIWLFVVHRVSKNIGEVVPRAAWGIALVFAPLFFSVYTLTKESTAIFEIALKALGV